MPDILLNMDGLLKLERELGPSVEDVLQKLAQDTDLYIKSNWSLTSPSAPGDAPAVDTGNLANSISTERVNEAEWHLNVDAAYAEVLEYGTKKMAARPFVLPAVEAVAANAEGKLIKVVEK